MRRALLPWLAAFVIAALAAVGSVAVLNATVFGAGGFVSVYLDALARGDVSDALSLPGVDAGGGDELLRVGAGSGLSGIHQLSDEVHDGLHQVTMGWTSPHGSGTTTFEVHRIGTRFALFPEWGFAVSPTATVSLAVLNDARYTVNGVQQVSAHPSDAAVKYAVLVPGSYTFGHTSTYLRAAPVTVLAKTVGASLTVTVRPAATAAFVDAVTTQLRGQLQLCTTQKVLFPTGCSFGQSISNRISGTPNWSMVSYPRISIIAGSDFGTWAIPPAPGTAHLQVPVTSLLDGTVTSFDQDVPFRLQATITLGADDAITVVQQ